MAEQNNYKKGSFLDHLTKALYDAVVQAQSLAENQHIEAQSKFFDKDGKPKCLDINIPDPKGGDQKVSVPYATLAPQGSIKIKELTMELKVKLGSFGKINVSTQLNQLLFVYKKNSYINSYTGNDIIKIYS